MVSPGNIHQAQYMAPQVANSGINLKGRKKQINRTASERRGEIHDFAEPREVN